MMIKTGKRAEVSYKERQHGRRKIVAERDGRDIIYTLINIAPDKPLIAGDEVILDAPGFDLEDDHRLELGGRAEPLVDGDRLIFDQPGRFKLRERGRAATRLVLPVATPPMQNPLEMELVGPDIYTAHANYGNITMRGWVDRVADADMNYFRDILPAHSWSPQLKLSIFPLMPDGRYDLSRLDVTNCRHIRAALWRGRQRGVVVQLDLLDHHLLRESFPTVWAGSEFNGDKNGIYYPEQGEDYTGRWENSVEHALKGVELYPPGHPRRALQIAYGNAIWSGYKEFIARYVPRGHIIGDGNELESRTLSGISVHNSPYGVTAYGGQPLRRDAAIPYILNDSALMERVRYICLHGSDLGTVQEIFNRIKPLLDRYQHIRVFFSTDGSRRPQNPEGETNRDRIGRVPFRDLLPLLELCRSTAGSRFGGLGDIKCHGEEDLLKLLAFWANQAA